MGRTRRRVGFWPLLGRIRLAELVWTPEFGVAAILAAAGGSWLISTTGRSERIDLAGDYLLVLAPLVAVVFAAFALFAGLATRRHLELLDGPERSIETFIAPFVIAIGVLVATLALGIGYRAAAAAVSLEIENVAFLALTFLTAFALFDVIALARNIGLHMLLAARSAEHDDNVSQLRSKSRT